MEGVRTCWTARERERESCLLRDDAAERDNGTEVGGGREEARPVWRRGAAGCARRAVFIGELCGNYTQDGGGVRVHPTVCSGRRGAAAVKKLNTKSTPSSNRPSRCSSLKELPIDFGQLKALTTLNLEHCTSLTTLPESIGQLAALTSLDLSQCPLLTVLPEELANLRKLTTLKGVVVVV